MAQYSLRILVSHIVYLQIYRDNDIQVHSFQYNSIFGRNISTDMMPDLPYTVIMTRYLLYLKANSFSTYIFGF